MTELWESYTQIAPTGSGYEVNRGYMLNNILSISNNGGVLVSKILVLNPARTHYFVERSIISSRISPIGLYLVPGDGDEGLVWEQVNIDSLAVSSGFSGIASSPTTIVATLAYDGEKTYASAYSIDGGNTWAYSDLPMSVDGGNGWGSGKVVWDGTRFIAGSGTRIWVSTDGISWSMSSALTYDTNRTFASSGGNVLVAYGTYNALLLRSVDAGSTWSEVTKPTNWSNYSPIMSYGGGKFLAYSSSEFWTSIDGDTWVSQGAPTFAEIPGDLHYGNGIWMVTGSAPNGNRVATSTDGLIWTIRSLPSDGYVRGITNAGEIWIIDSDDKVFRSVNNGVTWVTVSVGPGGGIGWLSVAGGVDLPFITIASASSLMYRSFAYASLVGLTWESIAHSPDLSLMCVDAHGSVVIAGANGGNTHNILRSTDNGATWTAMNLWGGSAPSIYSVTAILWTGTYWIICGNNGTGVCMAATSNDDGETWSVVNSSFGSGYAAVVLAKGGSTLVLIISGDYNVYVSTDDGVTWNSYNSGLQACYDVIWSGSRFVIAGYDGVSQSTDGTSWTATTSGIAAAHIWYGVAKSASEIVAVGYGASTMRSTDGGVNWVAGGNLPSGVPPNIRSVVYVGGYFLVIGSGFGSRSADGVAWQAGYNVPSNNVARFAVSNTKVIAVGYTGDNAIMRSNNS